MHGTWDEITKQLAQAFGSLNSRDKPKSGWEAIS